MKRSIYMALVLVLVGNIGWRTSAQITNSTDCSDAPNFGAFQSQNQTRAELLAQMDDEFVEKISEQTRCQDPLSSNSSSGASAGGGGSGAATSGNGAAGASTSIVQSPNGLKDGQESIVLDDSMSPFLAGSGNDTDEKENNGRKEQELLKADADAQQISQLRDEIAKTDDPELKKYFEDRIKELEN